MNMSAGRRPSSFLPGAVAGLFIGLAGPAFAQSLSFEQAYALPSAAEVAEVGHDIQRTLYAPRNVRIDRTAETSLNEVRFLIRFVSHDAPFGRHCGVVLTPLGSAPGSLAGFVDVPDVRWDYPTRNLERGLFSAQILGTTIDRYALILPCLRGHGLQIAGTPLQADGDRRDAYDGAANDVVAFARAAMTVAPELNPDRIGVYGSSRGGGVALLAASRSAVFRAVLAFAAPTDFFGSMGRPETDWAAAMAVAHGRADLAADSRESQQLEWFFGGRSETPWPGAVRRRLLGASPYYFASNLPAVQIHHGRSDRSVPVLNAQIIEHVFARETDGRPRTVHYHDAGHDLSGTQALEQGRDFFAQELLARSIAPWRPDHEGVVRRPAVAPQHKRAIQKRSGRRRPLERWLAHQARDRSLDGKEKKECLIEWDS